MTNALNANWLQKQSVKDATIFVDPTRRLLVRIYEVNGKIIFEFGITKELFEIYDKIAGHIKSN